MAALLSGHQAVLVDLVRIIHGLAPGALDELHSELQAAIASAKSGKLSEGGMLSLRTQYEIVDEGLRPPE